MKKNTGGLRLPVISPKQSIRPSRMGRRRAAVLIGIHLLIALHIVHWRLTGSTLTPVEPSEAMELSKHSVVNAGAIFFAAAILLTAVFGRFFCGWGCHLVALQDLSRSLLLKIGIRPKPFRSRLLRWVPAAAFLYMFVWPLVYRLWIRDSLTPLEVELTKSAFWETFPGWVLALATFVVCGGLIIYFLGAKGFCTYACPYGAVFGVADRVAPLSIRVTDACEGCGHCTATCSSNVRVHEEVRRYGMVVDSGCMKCMDCVSVCPNDALYLGWGKPSVAAGERPGRERPARRPEFTWTEEAVLAIAFVAAFLVFRGLYGVLPFLFSLGWAAILAYLCLQLLRLVTHEHLRIRTLALKRHGRVLAAGWGFAALMAGVGALWLHSGLIRYHDLQGGRIYASVAPLAVATTERGAPPTLTGEQRDRVEAALRHYGFLDRWSLRGSWMTSIRRAWLERLAGRPAAFRAAAAEALEAAPANAAIRVELANYFFRAGETGRAEELYREALEFEPRFAEAAINLGAIEVRRGRVAAAGAIFERALAAAPEEPRLHYNLAMVHVGFDRRDAAVERFERALELDPEFLEARENLAGYLCSLGRFEEGIVHYRAALERSPDDPGTRLRLAEAYIGAGELERAEAEARRAAALAPDRPEGRRMLERLARLRTGGGSG